MSGQLVERKLVEEVGLIDCSLSWQWPYAGQELEVVDQNLHTLSDRILIVQAAVAVGVEFVPLGRIR